VGGKTFSPSQALQWGLLDGTADTMPAVIEAARQWVLAHPQPRVGWDEPDFAIPALEQDLQYIALHGAAELYADGHGHYPARQAVFANAVEGSMVDIDTALRLETRYLTSLATGQVAKNMINTFFFQNNQIKGGKGRPGSVERVPERQLHVHGVSQSALVAALASAARRVPAIVCVDSEQAQRDAGAALDATAKSLIEHSRLPSARAQVARTAVSVVLNAQAPTAHEGLHLGEGHGGLAAYMVVLLPGNPASDATLPPGRVGVRALPDLLSASVVEVVCSPGCDSDLATRTYDFLQQLGKTPIVVSDAAVGFLKRMGRAAGREGLALCREGLSPGFVETVTLQTDMSQGALALAERFCAGEQSESEFATPGERDGPGMVREVQDRVLFIQALEALRCMEEGLVRSVMDANIASIQGIGFPSWTGGVIQYVNHYGLAKFSARAAALAQQCGERFSPPDILCKLVDAGARAMEA